MSHRLRSAASRGVMEIVFLALCLYLAWRAPNFLTPENLLSILRAVALQGLIAFGMTLVIIVGEIDLSVGAMVAFSGCLVAVLTQRGVPIPVAMLIALVVGFGVGLFTGMMRNRFQVPTFITTLALLTGLRGVALAMTGGFPVTPFPDWYSVFGAGHFPIAMFLLGFVVFFIVMRYTVFGRAIYASGGNPEAARLAGISVARVRLLALGVTSMLAAWSGVMLSGKLMSGTPTATEGWELDIIAAVIIGGTSFAGGVGTIWGTLVGILFIGVVGNGMTLMNVEPYTQYVIRGALIFAAVLLNRAQARAEGRKA